MCFAQSLADFGFSLLTGGKSIEIEPFIESIVQIQDGLRLDMPRYFPEVLRVDVVFSMAKQSL